MSHTERSVFQQGREAAWGGEKVKTDSEQRGEALLWPQARQGLVEGGEKRLGIVPQGIGGEQQSLNLKVTNLTQASL